MVVLPYFDKTTETVSKVTGTGVSYQITLDKMLAPPSEAKTRHGAQPDDVTLGPAVTMPDEYGETGAVDTPLIELLPY